MGVTLLMTWRCRWRMDGMLWNPSWYPQLLGCSAIHCRATS